MIMNSPIELWEDTVDISDTTVADFEKRNRSINCYDPEKTYRSVIKPYADECETSMSIITDFAIRVYVAHLCDSYEDIECVRDVIDQTRLVPPKGWIQENKSRLPTTAYEIERNHIEDESERQMTLQTSESVHTMITKLTDQTNRWENYSGFVKEAISFMANEFESSDPLIEEQLQTLN